METFGNTCLQPSRNKRNRGTMGESCLYVLNKNPAVVFERGQHHNVPFIAGTHTDEGTMFSWYQNHTTVEDFESALRKEYGDSTDLVLEVYAVTSEEQVKKAVNQHINDSRFAQPGHAGSYIQEDRQIRPGANFHVWQ